ncbi:LSm family RNA-binding protein [Candidatus Mancarchaeum acidiphilum]|uniref:Putative snRNP Sm-like protein n=1 Tax=Candidatus Mancarchaeum acidiphilum TaxID=1920749 RepID=A0A218NM82_9ARCH|nr:LSm family protein [Candidatus Mancarchaeum acidiphilum]ASI13575.1 LSm family RNA-binding protein [Candidatus Mancarchaeum acidiphilum]
MMNANVNFTQERPFDLLNKSIGKQVLVRLKNNLSIRGKITSFDAHMNIVMDGAEELDSSGELKAKLGIILLRGGNIIFVSPT